MFSYQVQIYESRDGVWGWYSLAGWTRPFTDGTRLDETLDSGTINLSSVKRSRAIKPFTRLRFIVSENGVEQDRIYRLVASARKTKRRYAGTPLYDWTINTIELTKLLERRLIDTMTVTKYLIRQEDDYPQVKIAAYENRIADNESPTPNLAFTTPCILGNSITIPSNNVAFNLPPLQNSQRYAWKSCSVTLVDDLGNTLETKNSGNSGVTPEFLYKPLSTGTIKIIYSMEIYRTNIITADMSYYGPRIFSCEIAIVNEVDLKSQPTITTVCERLLSAGVSRRKGVEKQEFLLEANFASEYANELAPEFSFTNSTLFEALLEVGGRIHAIPRVIPRSVEDDTHYYVTFDKLGGDEQAPTLPPMIFSEKTIDANDWCGKIDSPSQNLVNTEDVTGGAITELGNSYITVRTEAGQVEINGDNVIIRTSKPIQQIVKVECGYISAYAGGNTPVGDITPYVYESAEYQTLSSFWGSAYPYSKAWAIYYTQGGNTIEGLTFRWQDATSNQTAFANYAIANIINAVAGTSLTWKDTASGEAMRKLNFRVTYVPIAQARVKAQKPCLSEGGDGNNALTYNQSANIAETSFYGEKMRGAIARLGHDVETRTYDVFHYNQLPKVGQLLDGKYIAHVDYEYDITKIRITVALTKNFNLLSQFVGLNSNFRLYDISEKQSVERNVNYDELVVIGDAPNVDMSGYLMLRNPADTIKTILDNGVRATNKIAVAKLTPYDSNGNEIQNRAVILPAVAFPFGTSICLNVSYQDNYGAGYQQSNKYESDNNKAVQRLVPYTDGYGEIEELKISFTRDSGWTQTSASNFTDDTPAMMYPQMLTADNGTGIVATGDNRIVLQKDSREQINLTYQLHFVTTRPSIVIASGLSKYSDLAREVETPTGHTRVLWLKRTINGLNRFIDLQDGEIAVFYNGGTIENNCYVFNAICEISNAKSYAVCKEFGGSESYQANAGTNIYLNQNMFLSPAKLLLTSRGTTYYISNNIRAIDNPRVSGIVGETAIYVQLSTSTTIKLDYKPIQNLSFQCYGIFDNSPQSTLVLFEYDSTTNTVTIDNVGTTYDSYEVDYYLTEQTINGTVYVKTSDLEIIGGRYELIFGENIENVSYGQNVPTVYFAGAVAQACLQDEPSRLRFAPIGTTYYSKDESGELTEVGTLENVSAVGDYGTVEVNGATYYVNSQDVVSAYDFGDNE